MEKSKADRKGGVSDPGFLTIEFNFDSKGSQKLLLNFVSTLSGISKIQAKRVITLLARYVLIQLIKNQKVEVSHLGVFKLHNSRILFEPCAEMRRLILQPGKTLESLLNEEVESEAIAS